MRHHSRPVASFASGLTQPERQNRTPGPLANACSMQVDWTKLASSPPRECEVPVPSLASSVTPPAAPPRPPPVQPRPLRVRLQLEACRRKNSPRGAICVPAEELPVRRGQYLPAVETRGRSRRVAFVGGSRGGRPGCGGGLLAGLLAWGGSDGGAQMVPSTRS